PHPVAALPRHDVGEIIVYDNFVRGREENLAEALKDPRVKIFDLGGDILQTDILNAAMKGVDGVFHFAALWLLHCQDFPRSAFDVNIRGTFNVIEACVANNVQRLVYSSSASVYGDAVEEPMTEDHPFLNTNFYGATKIAGEAMLRSLHHRYKLPSVGLRYMNVYGPRQDYRGAYIAVIMKMLDRLDNGEAPVIYGDGSQAYDFVYVGDCAKANVCAMQADTVDRFYNVGTGRRTSIKELSDMILRLSGSPLQVRYEPEGQTFVKNRIGCPKRAAEEIGFTAGVPLEDGLRALIEWRDTHKAEVERRRRQGAGR
ncbi:NAD-dependent epimerase/dehydratase family protein, partial [Azospirillum sp. TSO22-1]|uniref:NAD-dependent epimerase/dehydratase family protein n=1 Tax=Azospirillum sp. TSO22-1 TaxID=716789 RepID=UPI000D614D3E